MNLFFKWNFLQAAWVSDLMLVNERIQIFVLVGIVTPLKHD